MTLFVDTSIWYAAADSSDRSNARAKATLKSGGQLVTSDHILVETWALLHHKVQRNAAERFWDGLRSGVAIIRLSVWQILRLPGKSGMPGVARISPSLIAPASL